MAVNRVTGAAGGIGAAGTAEDDVVAGIAFDIVGTAEDRIGRVNVVGLGTAVMAYDDTVVAEQDVVGFVTVDGVACVTTKNSVTTRATIDRVKTALLRIGRFDTYCRNVAGHGKGQATTVTDSNVIACLGIQHIVEVATEQHVVVDDRCTSRVVAVNRIVAAIRRAVRSNNQVLPGTVAGNADTVTDENIGTIVALDFVGAVAAGDNIVAVVAEQHVGTAIAGVDTRNLRCDARSDLDIRTVSNDNVDAFVSVNGVTAETTHQSVGSGVAVDRVIAVFNGTAIGGLKAGYFAGVKDELALIAHNNIGAGIAIDIVVSGTTDKDVVAEAAVDLVIVTVAWRPRDTT